MVWAPKCFQSPECFSVDSRKRPGCLSVGFRLVWSDDLGAWPTWPGSVCVGARLSRGGSAAAHHHFKYLLAFCLLGSPSPRLHSAPCHLSIRPWTVNLSGSHYCCKDGQCNPLPKWGSLILIKHVLSKWPSSSAAFPVHTGISLWFLSI